MATLPARFRRCGSRTSPSGPIARSRAQLEADQHPRARRPVGVGRSPHLRGHRSFPALDPNSVAVGGVPRHHRVVVTSALDRVRRDLAEGRLWKARDRVTGSLAARPSDPVLLELAGQVFFQMGDLPRAGAYWYLTDRDGPEVEDALAALRERHGAGAMGLIGALPVRDAIEAFPPRVQQRLRELQREARHTHNHDWDPQPRRTGGSARKTTQPSPVVEAVVIVAVVAATVGVWAIGAVTIIYVIGPWVIDRF